MPRNDDDNELYDDVCAMADRLKLKGAERNMYIHDHMTRAGYKRVMSKDSYRKASKDDDDESNGGFFSGRSRSRPERDDDDSF